MILRSLSELDKYLRGKVFLVCGKSIESLDIFNFIKCKTDIVRFSNFDPNPLYESVVEGVKLFNIEKCDTILAIGGGSAIDVAKCIKLFSNMGNDENYLLQRIIPNDIPLIAIPTTAGSGSEATRFAVIYYNKIKYSVSDESCIPSIVFFDPSVLKTLSLYQKKVTIMDALCHAIESYWSINSNGESKKYSERAIDIIIRNYEEYLAGDNSKNEMILEAANFAGKAINITQTTAGHALSYKLTSMYHISHGHAVSLCVKSIWPFMINHLDNCIDKRGKEYLKRTFDEIANLMGDKTVEGSFSKYNNMMDELGLNIPDNILYPDFEELKNSVNQERLANNPIYLSSNDITEIYKNIFGG